MKRWIGWKPQIGEGFSPFPLILVSAARQERSFEKIRAG